MKLQDVAHIRTGDKGDTSQISVIAYDSADFMCLRESVTLERVRAVYSALPCRHLTRYELPALGALVFVLEGALRGGVTHSTSLDPHGKTLGALLLDLDVEPVRPSHIKPHKE